MLALPPRFVQKLAPQCWSVAADVMVSLPWAEAPPCAPDEKTGTEQQTVENRISLEYDELGD